MVLVALGAFYLSLTRGGTRTAARCWLLFISHSPHRTMDLILVINGAVILSAFHLPLTGGHPLSGYPCHNAWQRTPLRQSRSCSPLWVRRRQVDND